MLNDWCSATVYSIAEWEIDSVHWNSNMMNIRTLTWSTQKWGRKTVIDCLLWNNMPGFPLIDPNGSFCSSHTYMRRKESIPENSWMPFCNGFLNSIRMSCFLKLCQSRICYEICDISSIHSTSIPFFRLSSIETCYETIERKFCSIVSSVKMTKSNVSIQKLDAKNQENCIIMNVATFASVWNFLTSIYSLQNINIAEEWNAR